MQIAYVFGMETPYGNRIVGVGYKQLPHMVAEFGRYAVTIRCANSLPQVIVQQLNVIYQAQQAVGAHSEDSKLLQRKLFLTLEKYADQGLGFAPFADSLAAEWLQSFLASYERDGLRFSAWVIMPNHLHLLTEPVAFASVESFMNAWQAFKGMSGKELNRLLRRSGSFWQTEWYDRLIRDEVEYRKWVEYLASNPVKAGLCRERDEFSYQFGLS
ncbi:transposase [Coraliomargarita sp. SDUM461004]|uniref:Transposase n=1 Tax=Thalassobacterium sedimentorum TaxID=3041258 RepID=A0ABU1ALS0_9BACT|nr:transposase [Coraliomargarita sp. SDUM461004]MDQ8195731.1 transposase [Coraliomargarita sp. SDUM461004]